MAKVAWIGLGVMGYPMAGHLLTKGSHELAVYNRNSAKAQAWTSAYGAGSTHSTPAAAAKDADFVFACVGNDDDLRQVTIGSEGAFTTMRPGAVFIDHTTASADVARELHAAAANKDLAFVDAPVSGGQAGAEAGQLTVMCGGDEEPCSAADPLIRSYAKAVRRMGPAGSGQLAKMVNQIAIAGLLQGLSEAIAFAENAGLDVAAVIDTISKGAAQSWQMENRWKSMHERRFDFGFAVDWMRKDLGICLAEANRNGSKLTVTDLVDRYYSDVQKLGGQRWDTSSLIARLPSPAATK
jgi:3-hydroxyisobutyrate dehydrogenase-like beta-hydroxyacid dehydrogenase